MRDLSAVIKAYDVRGIYPDEFSTEIAQSIGAAFVQVCGLHRDAGGPGAVIVGRDMRPSGPPLVAAFAEGVRSQGVDVVDIGLCATDGLYFAAGKLGLAGAMFTASHNPAAYNGIKMCLPGAVPVGQSTGLGTIKELVESETNFPEATPRGQYRQQDLLADYAAYLRSLVDLDGLRPLRIVVDAGNGMAGLTSPAVFAPLPFDITEMYFELDGTFPNHEANPIDPANMVDLQQAVVTHRADLGLAFDGDADRCFVVDERGELVSPSTLTALIAVAELGRHPGSNIIHNLITSAAVPEIIAEHGGTPVRTRVGHSYIKAEMAASQAVFGGEHSGHFYFQDFWRADSGMLAALHVLSALGHTPAGTTASELFSRYIRYSASGEINSVVGDVSAALQRVRAAFADRVTAIDTLDGITFTGEDWWFNVRPSNTEPLLRLNVEAADDCSMAELRDQVLAVIRAE